MIDLVLVAIVAVIAWCLSGEGAYAAGMTLIAVIISGLLAMNFFEPLATMLENNVAGSWANRWDMIALIGLFAVFVTLFRLLADKFMPTYVQVHPVLHQVGSWGCGLLTGYVTMAFLLTALHTAPMPRDYWGFFYPERQRRSGPLSQIGPDYQWLGFTQYVTERPFGRSMPVLVKRGTTEEIHTTVRMFDGRSGLLWDIPRKDDAREPYDIMPSFPIRYAARREQLETGSTGPAVKVGPATTTKRKTGGGRRRLGGP